MDASILSLFPELSEDEQQVLIYVLSILAALQG